MARAIRIPDFGTSVEEVRLICWLKREGDSVRPGEPLCEVETDKANGQLESEAEGVLLRHLAPPGAVVKTGAVIGLIGRAGEEVPPASEAPGQVQGLRQGQAEVESPPADHPTGAGKPMSGNQLAVARRVARSHREIPSFDMVCRVEMTRALDLRQRTQAEIAGKVSFDAIFIYALSRLIGQFDHFRSRVVGEEIVVQEEINVAFAAGFRDALYALVVRQADRKSPAEIEQEVQRLLTKAASRHVTVEDLTGACMTVSNLGMYPVRSFSVIIPPGQGAGLAVGAIEEALVMRAGKVAAVPMVSLTLTADHRLINGREAAQFLARLKEFMEGL